MSQVSLLLAFSFLSDPALLLCSGGLILLAVLLFVVKTSYFPFQLGGSHFSFSTLQGERQQDYVGMGSVRRSTLKFPLAWERSIPPDVCKCFRMRKEEGF